MPGQDQINDQYGGVDNIEPGQIVSNRFSIEEHLGSGATGIVYKAHDTSLDMSVAIKFLRNHLLRDDTALQRFHREAKTLAGLEHENIVKIHGFGHTEKDVPYIVMEFIPGRNLSEELREKGKFSPSQVIDLMLTLSSALVHAHARQILHRDLKTSNIILSGSSGSPKVFDFGLAQLLSDPHQKLTALNTLIGTPAYMSPEQCSGAEITEQSDVYSLGCIGYECLTGRRPIEKEDAVSTMHEQISGKIEPLPPDLPRSLRQLIERMLEKDPAKRPKMSEVNSGAAQLKQATTNELRQGCLQDRIQHVLNRRNLATTGIVLSAVVTGAVLFQPETCQLLFLESVGSVLPDHGKSGYAHLVDRFEKKQEYYKALNCCKHLIDLSLPRGSLYPGRTILSNVDQQKIFSTMVERDKNTPEIIDYFTLRLKYVRLLQKSGLSSEAIAEYQALLSEFLMRIRYARSHNDKIGMTKLLNAVQPVPDGIGVQYAFALAAAASELRWLNRLDEAEVLARRALTMEVQARCNQDTSAFITYLECLVDVLLEQKNFAEADVLTKRLLEVARMNELLETVDCARWEKYRARALLGLHNAKAAEPFSLRSIVLANRAPEEYALHDGCLGVYHEILLAQHRFKEAALVEKQRAAVKLHLTTP